MKYFCSAAMEKPVFSLAIKVSLIVGTILTVINQNNVIFSTDIANLDWIKLGLTFIVPYFVSTYSSVVNMSKIDPGNISKLRARLFCTNCKEEMIELNKGEIIPECKNCKKSTNWKMSSGNQQVFLESDFVRHNPSPVLRINVKGDILDKNVTAQKMLPSDIVNVFDYFDSFRELDLVSIVENTQKTEVAQVIGNQVFQFEIVGLKNENICQIYGSDITMLESYKNELQALAKFPMLNPSPVIRVNNEGIVTSSNPKANDLFNRENINELDLTSLFPFITYDDIRSCINNSDTKNYTETIGKRHYKVIMKGLKELQACQIYTSDITEIEQSRKDLNSHALFARLNPEPVLRFDEDGIVKDANIVANNVLTGENIVGTRIQNAVKKLEEFDIKKCINEGTIITIEEKIGEFVFRFIIRGIPDLEVCQMYGSDITQRVKAENKVRLQGENIRSSIRAAKLIQNAVLPNKSTLDRLLPENFILYMPKDIVSGDFYWIGEVGDRVIFTAVDCTGHGVPGGFMSMLGISNLNNILAKNEFDTAADILMQLRANIKIALGDNAKDGMDMGICIWDKQARELQYSGAYNPLIIVRNNELIQIKGDRMPVGLHFVADKEFTNHVVKIEKGDQCYLFSDGYADQFGGKDGLKFSPEKLRMLLKENSSLSMEKQKEQLEKEFMKWKGEYSQIDDVLLIGIKF